VLIASLGGHRAGNVDTPAVTTHALITPTGPHRRACTGQSTAPAPGQNGWRPCSLTPRPVDRDDRAGGRRDHRKRTTHDRGAGPVPPSGRGRPADCSFSATVRSGFGSKVFTVSATAGGGGGGGTGYGQFNGS